MYHLLYSIALVCKNDRMTNEKNWKLFSIWFPLVSFEREKDQFVDKLLQFLSFTIKNTIFVIYLKFSSLVLEPFYRPLYRMFSSQSMEFYFFKIVYNINFILTFSNILWICGFVDLLTEHQLLQRYKLVKNSFYQQE